MANWYEINNTDELDSPALLVFPERVKYNIQLAIQMTGGAGRLRPHVKTHKSGEVAKLMMEAGISKFKCATIAEAEMLAQQNAPDVLLAYPPVGPKVNRFISLKKKYPATRFSCLTDNRATAEALNTAFLAQQLAGAVYIDLDTGMNRTGIAPEEKAIELYKYCSTAKGLTVMGLHAYDGHLRDADFDARKQRCKAGFMAVDDLKAELVRMGLPVPAVIAGGSPTFPVHAENPAVECSPGTFIYWDKNYSDSCPEQNFKPAALVLTRVISLPAPGRICLDLGHKSVASENALEKRVYFLNAPGLKFISHNEEHLVAETHPADEFKAGDVLYGLPFHICPTVALYDSVYTIENGRCTGQWAIPARSRKISV